MSNSYIQKVSMTPIQNGNVRTIKIDKIDDIDDPSKVYLEAQGKNSGLVINREGARNNNSTSPEMQLEFTCMMKNLVNDDCFAENRRIKFWFKDGVDQIGRIDGSYAFFKQLIDPKDFPKDYANFIKKAMKQLQYKEFESLREVDIDFIQLNKKEQDALVPRVEEKPKEIIIRENLQARLDEAYPNYLSMDDLIKILGSEETMINLQIDELLANNIIERVQIDGKTGYRRKLAYHEEVTVVKENDQKMQKIFKAEKPTIAIVTNLVCEKLAVDSMMTNKTTFVKFEGESHVYTIGVIGKRKVISTKVPMVGREMKARIASANTITRLLGTFQSVDHVILVGVGGSVAHVYEFDKHSRLGDIVVSYETDEHSKHQWMYYFCEEVIQSATDNKIDFKTGNYEAKDSTLKKMVDKVLDNYVNDPAACEWKSYMDKILPELEQTDIAFSRPPPETDKLKLRVSETVTFDIKHPEVPPEMENLYRPGVPAVRLGHIGSGGPATNDDSLKDKFAKEHCLLAYDSEFDQVLESIKGSGLRSFLIIRGMADYHDGSKGGLWQPYASLAAAGFMKSVIMQMKG